VFDGEEGGVLVTLHCVDSTPTPPPIPTPTPPPPPLAAAPLQGHVVSSLFERPNVSQAHKALVDTLVRGDAASLPMTATYAEAGPGACDCIRSRAVIRPGLLEVDQEHVVGLGFCNYTEKTTASSAFDDWVGVGGEPHLSRALSFPPTAAAVSYIKASLPTWQHAWLKRAWAPSRGYLGASVYHPATPHSLPPAAAICFGAILKCVTLDLICGACCCWCTCCTSWIPFCISATRVPWLAGEAFWSFVLFLVLLISRRTTITFGGSGPGGGVLYFPIADPAALMQDMRTKITEAQVGRVIMSVSKR